MVNIVVKRFIFAWYVPIIIFAFVLLTLLFVSDRQARDNASLFIPVFGALFSFFFFSQKQQLEELGIFRELFKDFNGRYDNLSAQLNEMLEPGVPGDLLDEQKKLLNEYFNLCGEEYLYYRQGYIYPEVWTAWCNGMSFYLKDKRIRAKWMAEEKTNSYYGLTLRRIENSRRH